MSEGHPLAHDRQTDPGDQGTDPSALAPEVVALVGEDAVAYMERATGALDELERMAEAPDPFVHDDRGHQVDLGFLNDEQAGIVQNFRTLDRPFKGLAALTVARFGRRMVKKMPSVHRDIREKVDASEPYVDGALESIRKVADETPQNEQVSVLGSLKACMDELMVARDRIPSKMTMLVVDNMYGAGLNARNSVQSRAGQSVFTRNRETPKMVRLLTNDLRQGRENFKGVAKLADAIRKLGTSSFQLLQELVEVERVKEALGIIGVADRIRERLSAVDGEDGYGPEAIAAAESYVAEHAAIAEAVLQSADPEILQDHRLKPIMTRLRPPSPEPAAAETSGQQPAIGNEVLGRMTEAKNILRGGRRLKPEGNGQTQDDIKRIADELHGLKDGDDSLLDPEESGVIVAMVTGKFESFSQVYEAVKNYAHENGLGSFPEDRRTVAMELERFDLEAALAKIGSTLLDTDNRLQLERVIGLHGVQRVETILEQAAAADEPEENAA